VALDAGSIGWGRLTWIGRLALARKDIICATTDIGSRLPLDRTTSDLRVGMKPDGRIPVNAVYIWGVHSVGVSSGRTMGIIDGIVGFPQRVYVIHPLLA
jgi:hypothetical protein